MYLPFFTVLRGAGSKRPPTVDVSLLYTILCHFASYPIRPEAVFPFRVWIPHRISVCLFSGGWAPDAPSSAGLFAAQSFCRGLLPFRTGAALLRVPGSDNSDRNQSGLFCTPESAPRGQVLHSAAFSIAAARAASLSPPVFRRHRLLSPSAGRCAYKTCRWKWYQGSDSSPAPAPG